MPDLERGKVPEDWWYFPVVARLHKERTGYPTQKPESLLQRILLASSNEDDLVADLFCGSGTTAAVASRLGRRFLACDSSFLAVHTTRKRLCAVPAEPFSLEHEDGKPLPKPRSRPLAVRRTPNSVRVGAEPDLDYWEVDPEWGGSIFRSAAQAQRPTGAGELSSQVDIRSGSGARVRGVSASGERLEGELDVQAVADAANGLEELGL
jgi:hypothetical protein